MLLVFFFQQKTAYEMRISDWSSDVCASDLLFAPARRSGLPGADVAQALRRRRERGFRALCRRRGAAVGGGAGRGALDCRPSERAADPELWHRGAEGALHSAHLPRRARFLHRSEEHTSELQSLMRISYAVFCLTKNKSRQSTTK